jgi:hypothetical protein
MNARVSLLSPTSKASAEYFRDSDKLKRSCTGILLLQGILLLCHPVLAAGTTAGVSLEYLDELLWQLTIYPYVGVGFSYLIFGITRKAWVFFLAPILYWGLSSIAPLDPTFVAPDSPTLLSAAGAWFYWTHVFTIATAYVIFGKTKKVWIFFLAPVAAWVIQIGYLLSISA